MQYYVSEAGLAKLQQELEKARLEFAEICCERKSAFELAGDGWHDNPHFNRLQQLEAAKSSQIAELQRTLDNCRVITTKDGQRPTNTVALGSIITIDLFFVDSEEEKTEKWEITGYKESDPRQRMVAYNAPLARPLLGLKKGDDVSLDLPKGTAIVTILDFHQSRG